MSRILLVEDEPFLSSLLKNRLEKEGFEVTLAKDGEEALNSIRSAKPDLVLLDVILPKKSGFELIEELRKEPKFQAKDLPVIILSNLGQPEDVSRGEDLGATQYLIKAKISIDDLVQKIKDLLKKNGAK